MDTKLVALADLEGRDLAAWRELADRSVEPNPFFDPDLVLPAARALGEWDDVGIMRVREGTDWAACLPVKRYSRWHGLPLPSVSTWLHTYCFLGTPLVAPGDDSDGSLVAAVEKLRKASGAVSFSALEWTSAEGYVAEALQQSAPPRPVAFEEFTRPTLVRREQCDYLDGIKGKHRSEFGRLARRLEAELDGPLQLVDRTDAEGAVDVFMHLEASGWKGREGTALASNPAHAEFFREMAAAFAARGALQLLFLEANGQAIAALCNLIAGNGGFGFKLAHDERYNKFGPGRELHLRAIERFHDEQRLTWIDSCASPECSLLDRLFPDRRRLVTSVYPARGPLGVAAGPGIWGSRTLRARLGRSPAA